MVIDKQLLVTRLSHDDHTVYLFLLVTYIYIHNDYTYYMTVTNILFENNNNNKRK